MPFFSVSNLLWSAMVFAAFGLSVCLHEFGHAIAAYWGGDRAVKEKGYLTLNPLRYTHLTNSIVLPFIFLLMGGIPLPGAAVYINHGALRSRLWKSAVSAAGPLATFLVAVVLASIISLLPPPVEVNPLTQESLLFEGVALLLTLETAGVFLNLIPIPGLDGYGIIRPWLPTAIQQRLRPVAKYGVWILVGAFWFVPQFSGTFWSAVISVVQACGVSPQVAFLSLSRFQSGARVLFFGLLVIWIGYTQWQKRQPQAPESFYGNGNGTLLEKLARLDAQLTKQPTALTYARKAAILTDMARYDEALTTLDESLAITPKDNETAHQRYVAYLRGNIYLAQENYNEAVTCFDRSLALLPAEEATTRIHMLFQKASAYFFQQRYEDSLATFQQILSETPDDANALYNTACCYSRLSQIEPGIAALTQALEKGQPALREQAMEDEDLAGLRSHPNYPNP